jgi:hypothetical protein
VLFERFPNPGDVASSGSDPVRFRGRILIRSKKDLPTLKNSNDTMKYKLKILKMAVCHSEKTVPLGYYLRLLRSTISGMPPVKSTAASIVSPPSNA